MLKNKYCIEEISLNEYTKIINEKNTYVPIYMQPDAIKFYKKVEIIKICKSNNIVALYAYPVFQAGEELWVKREYRFLPYSSPLFFDEYDTLELKKICYEIFKYMFQKYKVTYIPLEPNFKSISSIQSLGGFIEERSTNIVQEKIDFVNLSSKLKNHIRHAEKTVKIDITQDCNEFNYESAIKGNEEEQYNRKKMARFLVKKKKGVIVNAYENGENIAGALIIYDMKSAYLLHTWQNIDTTRGTIPLIIYKAINWCFENLKINTFDFEGSVIDSIDDFFATFNTKISVYPYIHFAQESDDLIKIIKRSINITGRKKENE